MNDHTELCTSHGYACDDDQSLQQPPGFEVEEARSQLDDDAPWCRVHELAWKLAAQDA